MRIKQLVSKLLKIEDKGIDYDVYYLDEYGNLQDIDVVVKYDDNVLKEIIILKQEGCDL